MTEVEAFARNQRFSGKRSCIITDCGEGQLALFGWGGSGPLLYLGPDIEALAQAFFSRPEYTPKFAALETKASRPSAVRVAGIDLSSLDIDL